MRFQNGCREGHTEIAFAATGTNLQLVFGSASGNYAVEISDCDFEKDCGKVSFVLTVSITDRKRAFRNKKTVFEIDT